MTSDNLPKEDDELARAESPNGTQAKSQPINDTSFHRFLTLSAIRVFRRFCSRVGSVVFLPSNICIKYGPDRNFLSEGATLQFIANHTSIPVPKVLCSFEHKGWSYLVMERLDGDMLAKGWSQRSPASKIEILSQLRNMIQELRSVPAAYPNGKTVANIDGDRLWDCRFPSTEYFGPFISIGEFHRYLRNGIEAHPENLPDVAQMTTSQDQSWGPPVFTHGDFSSLNVLVKGNKVIGIVDWEISGWYPKYWEYTTARQVNPRNFFWADETDKFLDPFPGAWEMEQARLRYFGDVN